GQRGDLTLNAASPRDVDHGETCGVKNIAGNDDIRAAEEHDRIAVRVCGRLMQDLNTFAVEVHVFSGLLKSFRRQPGYRKWRCLAVWSAHPGQHLFVRQNRSCASEEIRTYTRSATLYKECLAGFRNGLISANVIGIHVCIDHVPYGERRDSLDCSDDSVAS